MQYKIEGSFEQIEALEDKLFYYYPHQVKNNQLIIEAEDHTFAFLSMVRAFLKRPVSVNYMTQDLVKFVIL